MEVVEEGSERDEDGSIHGDGWVFGGLVQGFRALLGELGNNSIWFFVYSSRIRQLIYI